ncbi:MAG TPA: hypothetical protein ENH10_03165 [Bacteroidetes bacterium]|nr:hypothetical protein [Bacteroidota bacterium]HEX04142.1 hypothetical protein [Bacteroidota bacterium]
MFLTHNPGDSWVEIDTFYDYSNVNDVAASRGDPNRLYLVSDGLWRSDDDGVSWQMVNEISYVEIETGLQPDDVFSGNYRSLDGGVTWDVLDYTNTGIAVGEYGYYVTEVAYDPANTDRVFILASAARFEEPDNPQPYYTTDFGDTWQQPSGMPQYTWEGDYYFDPLRPERVYFRRRDQGGSLYRSDDGGANFALLQDEAYQLEFAPNSDRLIAWSSDGLFSSIDGGETLDLFGELAGEEPLNVEITGAEQVVVLTATSVWFCDPNLDNSLWTRLLLTDLPHEDGFAVSESGTLFLVSEGLRRNAGLLVSAPETDNTRLPDRFELLPVTPNPFNATARVDIALPVPTTVRLEVLNVLGQSMTVLADRRFAAGHHQFVLDGSNWASGAYLLRASVEGYGDQTRRMILLK